jgi:predicted AAA+ superfamily ATPase
MLLLYEREVIIMKRKIEAQLLAWKNKETNRMPLIISGARQVGKTYTLRQFGEEHFKKVVYVNLETNMAIASYFNENISPVKLLRYLESSAGEKIIPGETLLIFDEIQSCERALTSLKYFYEETPQYHIAAAGSLLGVAINRQHYSFPVGKVETISLYPLDFEEYLWARNEELLCGEIWNSFKSMEPLPEALHLKAQDLFREYLIIGGMPACINAFLTSGSFIDVPMVQSGILDNYIADMSKYASSSDSVKIRACYNSIPAQLAKDNKKFQYKIVQKGGSTANFGVSIEWLNLAGVVLKCQRIDQAVEPISVYADLSAFKLYMGDVGLLAMKSGISQQTILSGEGNTFMGALTENYVAQQFAAKGYELYYWESNSIAELDFVLQKANKIIGVEVKKGKNVRSRSLNVFIGNYRPAYSIRFSLKNFGEKENLKSVPLYAAFCV